MLRIKPLSTSTFKLTLAYLGLFSLSALTLMAVVYTASVRFMEQQTRETIEDEIAWLLEQYRGGRLDALRTIIGQQAAAEPNRRAIYLLADADGRPIVGNISALPEAAVTRDDFLYFPMQVMEGRRQPSMHMAMAQIARLGGGEWLLVGRDIQDKVHTQRFMRAAIFLGAGIMVLLGVCGGLVMSRWMLYRLELINRTTAQIMAGDLGKRIRIDGGGDEFDELAQNLNAMLERIERLLTGMRQVTDDIAHDLRTPLTRMRSRIEVALLSELRPEEGRELLEATLQDADGLIATFNALLSIARAEAGAQQSEWERVDLAEVARDVLELYEPLAEERGIAIELSAQAPVMILGNRQLVAQAMANIIDNAIKYTPEGGCVAVLTQDRPTPAVIVADNGPGIPEHLREHAKERFVRLDPERSTPGSGLGLSLVQAVAKLHEAKLDLGDNRPGLRVTLTFKPASPAALSNARQAVAA